ncbi:MAG: efflux RND transporter periplasmic adaptor subunit [Patescibacteria group bacterium]
MRRYWIYAAIFTVVLILGIGGFLYFRSGPAPEYDLAVAKRGNVLQEVSVTGSVKPAQSVDLAFEQSGRVSAVKVAVGDRARAGDILSVLYSNDIAAQLSQAEADVSVERAKLDELLRGTRPEEMKLQEIKVGNSAISLAEAEKNLRDKLQDAYTKSDDAVRNNVDQFMSNPRSANPQLDFSLADLQLGNDIEWQRVVVEDILSSWSVSLNKFTAESDLNAYVNEAKQNLDKVKLLLDRVALAVNSLTASANFSQTKIDGWRSDISTGRTNVNTAINNISAAEDKWRAAESAKAVADQELALLKAGTTEEGLRAQRALLQRAEATVLNMQVALGKTVLRSPIDGTVTIRQVEVGEIVAANGTVFKIISELDFMLEANVPEVDIAKVKIGNSAAVTLDAYGSGELFNATVVKIDPGELVIEGVPTYKVTLSLADGNGRVRSGMSANIDIMTARKENVIFIPYRALIIKNGDKIVRVLRDGGVVEEVGVETGLRGSDGNVEIIQGVKEGDNIIVFIK